MKGIYRTSAITFTLFSATFSLFAGETASFPQPYLDRWMYAANASPGSRGMASVFANPGDWSRLGQFMVGFDLGEKIPTGKGATSYRISSMKLTLVTAGQPPFTHDSTYDTVASYLGNDGDAGKPIELHGVGYLEGYSGEDFLNRRTPISGADGRTAYPLSWDEEGKSRDVSQNVASGFESRPWAVGRVLGVEDGEVVNEEKDVEFTLQLTDQKVMEYLQSSFDQGKIYLMISSLQDALQQGGTFVNFFTSDSQEEFFFGGYSPKLEVEYTIVDVPQVPAPVIHSIGMNGGQLSISWQQHRGFKYLLESSVDCKSWSRLSEFVATEDRLFSHVLQAPQGFRFYRIRREPN
ncbi:MAG: hypothetical protein MK183_14985 [Verrucomicrobiales bacterium]|nr:hypothetical protein [Verrucomicrobiales bacterium]